MAVIFRTGVAPEQLPEKTPEEANVPESRVRGKISRVLFSNEEDSFYIFLVQPTGTKNNYDQVKVKGYGHRLEIGQEVDCLGVYEAGKGNYKDELSLNAKSIKDVIPTSLEGIRKMLHGGAFKGIGKKYADLMLSYHGANLLDIAEFSPEKVISIPGLGEARGKSFCDAVKERKATPRIMSYLAEIGLGPGLSHRVFKELGMDAVNKIKENPYSLTDIPLIGFAMADKVAREMGVPSDSLTRIEAGIKAMFEKEADGGSTAVTFARALGETSKLLSYPSEKGPQRVASDLINEVLESSSSVRFRTQSSGEVILSLDDYVKQEDRIARNLTRLSIARTRAIRNVDTSSPHFAHLDEGQKEAARMALTSNVSVITGRPGCGKTTVTKSIIQSLQSAGLSYLACGPTGRAAKRFMEATGFQASTMHRALESKGGESFLRNERNPLSADFIIADEQSMSDTYISDCLLKAVASGTQLLYVGDVDQLSSIGPGAVLKDIIQSGQIPVATLSKIHRQAAGSDIIVNAHRIIEGQVPFSSGAKSDFSIVDCKESKAQIESVIAQYKRLVASGYAPEDIQILTPMRKKTELGSNSLNRYLKEILNPSDSKNSIKRGKFENEVTFSTNDRVMQVVNNKELGIFNGDIGYIKSIDKALDEIVIDFSGETVTVGAGDLSDLDLAYATTIHKSQGSEFPAVIIPISNEHWMMWDRNLLYTAVTRGKSEVVLTGDASILKRVVSKQNSSQRLTGLCDEIEHSFDMASPKARHAAVSKPKKSSSFHL